MGVSNNTGRINMPRIVQSAYGGGIIPKTIRKVALDSSVHYLGGFVGRYSGTEAGLEFGIPTYADDQYIWGFVVGIYDADGVVVTESSNLKGTITAATAFAPYGYTFSATNDESNTTSADLEFLEIQPVMPGDTLEVTLCTNAGTATSNRGTTTVAGTTTSTDNLNVSMNINATAPWCADETTGVVATANMDFITTKLNMKQPARSDRVYVDVIRSAMLFQAAD